MFGSCFSSTHESDQEVYNSDKPSKEVVIAWHNLTVTVSKKTPTLFGSGDLVHTKLLNNVSGYFKSGSLTAVMGASGAGKTTLLSTVSQRAKFKRDGDLLFNGRVVSSEYMAKVSGFVPQHDLVFSSLTVSEHMEFMAALTMGSGTKRIHRYRRIYCLLTEFGLLHCCNNRLDKLSGGEMKRVSLAVQLLTDPPVLFCDEPTTGLDSYSAGVVLEHLRQCAEQGKAVLATIHQPASGHFHLFHQVMLLAAGRVAYSGPVHHAPTYFSSLGLVCPPTYNQAEFYVQQLGVMPGLEDQCLKRNNWLCDKFTRSAHGAAVAEIVMEQVKYCGQYGNENWLTSESLHNVHHDFKSQTSLKKPGVATQLYFLSWRSYLDMKRNCADIILRYILLMLTGALISTPYIGITEHVGQNTIQNLEGLMHLITTEVIFGCSYTVFHTFPNERPILLRELADRLYTPAPYYLSKIVLFFFRTTVESFTYGIFIFYVVQLNGGFAGLFIFVLPIVTAGLTATAYGFVMSAAFESVNTSSLMSAPIELVGVMYSGIYLHLLGLPSYLSWIKYLSMFYYCQEALSITQWRLIPEIECFPDPLLPCIGDGEGALMKFGYHSDNYLTDLAGLAALYLVLHLIGFTALWIRSRKSATY